MLLTGFTGLFEMVTRYEAVVVAACDLFTRTVAIVLEARLKRFTRALSPAYTVIA